MEHIITTQDALKDARSRNEKPKHWKIRVDAWATMRADLSVNDANLSMHTPRPDERTLFGLPVIIEANQLAPAVMLEREKDG